MEFGFQVGPPKGPTVVVVLERSHSEQQGCRLRSAPDDLEPRDLVSGGQQSLFQSLIEKWITEWAGRAFTPGSKQVTRLDANFLSGCFACCNTIDTLGAATEVRLVGSSVRL